MADVQCPVSIKTKSPLLQHHPMNAHPFDQAIALERLADGSWLGHTSPAYGNMVGPFGGVLAAKLLNAVLQHPDRLGDPIALTVNYCAGLLDGPFTVQARTARTNRSTQHWLMEIVQGSQAVLTATAVTAVRRDTWNLNETTMPDVSRPADTPITGGKARMEWVNRYELRFVHGNLPEVWDGSDSGDSLTQVWLRDAPARALDFASLAALSDIFFPRIMSRRATPTHVGTVSMTIYFHADAPALHEVGTGYLLGQAKGQAFRNGFFDHTAQLWSEAGTLLVTTHQIVYYKS